MIPNYKDHSPHITGRDGFAHGRREHCRSGLMGTTALYDPVPAMLYYKGGGFGGILKGILMGAVLGAVTGGIGFELGLVEGASVFGLSAGLTSAVAAGAAVGAIGGILQGAAAMIMGTQQKDQSQSFTYEAHDNKLTVRNTTAPRKKIYGTALAAGALVYATSTGTNNKYMHLVTPIASHQVKAFRECYFNNNPATDSRYSNLYRINKHLGTQTQTADSDLVSEASNNEWTNAHRGRGIAYIYPRLEYSQNAWVSGLPSTQVMTDGAIYYDPRSSYVSISTSTVASPGVFATIGAHGLSAGDIVFIKDHIGATYASTNGLSQKVSKHFTVNTVPSSTTFTLLNDSGEPMPVLTAGSGGTVSKCAWSNNWSLAILDYLLSRDGINCATGDIDFTYFSDAANVSDESVVLGNSQTFTVSATSDQLTLANNVGWQTGTQIYLTSSGTLPAPLAAGTAYYWIASDANQNIGQLSTSYANAVDTGTAIDLTDTGTGTHTITVATSATISAADDTITLSDTKTYIETGDCVTLTGSLSGTDYYWFNTDYKVGKLATSRTNAIAGTAVNLTLDETVQIARKSQARYTVNGIVDLSKKPIDILNELLTAGGGVLVYTQGKYRLFAAAPAAAIKTISQDNLRDDIGILPRPSRADLYNAVRGTYKEPAKYWEMTDFPPVTNATYEADDGGQRLYKDIVLPHTIDDQRAQRIASIALGRARNGMTINFPGKVQLLGISAWDCVSLDLDVASTSVFSNKKFRVIAWSLAENAAGVDLTLQEESDASYDWSYSGATVRAVSDLNYLPDPWNVSYPVGFALTEDLYETRTSSGVKAKATLTWDNSGSFYVRYTSIRYRIEGSGDGGWIEMSPVAASTIDILDIAPGVYEFQGRNFNQLGAVSDWSPSFRKEVFGLGANPSAMQGLTISAISSMALMRWKQSADLDVRIGGTVVFRHSPATVGAVWSESTSIGTAIPGSDTVAVLPLLAGTYLARFVDSTGNMSDASTVTTDGATVLAFATVDTVTEGPTFPGSKTSVFVSGGNLQLSGSADIDSIADFDTMPSVDLSGGVASSGEYLFATGIDLGSAQRVRLVKSITASIVNTIDLFDDRTENIDDWANFDGTGAANADAVVYVRATQTDPLGSPTWTDWQRLDVAEFSARAFQFKCVLTTDDPAYNIYVSSLSVRAEQL